MKLIVSFLKRLFKPADWLVFVLVGCCCLLFGFGGLVLANDYLLAFLMAGLAGLWFAAAFQNPRSKSAPVNTHSRL